MVVLSGNISFGRPFFGAGFRDGGLALVEFLSIIYKDIVVLENDVNVRMHFFSMIMQAIGHLFRRCTQHSNKQ